jgi:ribosomal protein S18 acetylase RimI-like enzyme
MPLLSNLTIEDCLKADVSKVQELCDDLYSEDPNISDVRVDIELTWKEFSEHSDKGRLLAIKDQNYVVGYCIIIFFWSNEYSGDLMEIDELNIAKSHRGQGAGKQLFSWLRAEYPLCKGVTLQVAEKNERARKWYHSIGFTLSRNQHLIWVLN